MKDKNKQVLLVLLFIVTIIFNYFYGSVVYSKISGQEKAYTIGKLCGSSRTDCENIYFKDYLDKINSLSNESRSYFSNIFIQENIMGYTGNCPCPYYRDSRGSICGKRSSYSKHGQISYCYDFDISDSQIAQKKAFLISQAKNDLNDAVQKNTNVYNEKYTLFLVIIFYGTLFIYLKHRKTLK